MRAIDLAATLKIIDKDLGSVRHLVTPDRLMEIISSPQRYTDLQIDLMTLLFASIEYDSPPEFTEACGMVISLLLAAKNGPPPSKKKTPKTK